MDSCCRATGGVCREGADQVNWAGTSSRAGRCLLRLPSPHVRQGAGAGAITMRAVLFVGRWFPPLVGGIENYLFELYRRLPAGRADLLLPDEAGATAFDHAHPDLRVIRVRLPAGVSSASKRALGPLLRVALRRFIRPGYRQVHCGHILTGVAGYLAKRIWGRPYVVFTYGAELTREGLSGLKRAVLRNATAVITISRYTTEQAV